VGHIKMLRRENVPCWSEFSWVPVIPFRRKTPTIILRVHKNLQSLFPAGGIAPVQEEFDFRQGEESLIRTVQGFINLLIPLPKVKKPTGLPCKECEGAGQRDEMDCLYCEGEGQVMELDLTEVNRISEKLALLTRLLRYPPEQDTPSDLPQLLVVETMFREDMGGGSLWGEYSVPLVNWLGILGWERAEIPEMAEAMKVAYTHMMGSKFLSDSNFWAVVENNKGWLNVSCPGSGCGLHPNSHGWDYGEGYEFSCHNVDNSLQQLTLLAGLAALHDRARHEIRL